MRRKQLVQGLNNSQKIRFMINGFGMYCRISDLENFATTSHRVAIWDCLNSLVRFNSGNDIKASGQSGTWNGHNVQVDLIKE